MTRQGELFPRPETVIHPAPSRAEPLVWVKRLLIWESPTQLLREIRLHKGLNIIWSPDPGAQGAELGQPGGSGHGAGKTLFVRLMRYCLGEDTFANAELRAAVAQALPQGLVGAEVMVGATSWGVVRSLGGGRRARVGTTPLEELVRSGSRATGMGPLLEAISEALHLADLDDHLPGRLSPRAWHLGLAWMSRDQECRFSHLLEWRDKDSESRSPAENLERVQGLQTVRLLLDAIQPEEIQARERLEAAGRERQNEERRVSFLRETAERLVRELVPNFGLDPGLPELGPLAIHPIAEAARSRAREAEARLEPDEEDPELGRLRREVEGVRVEIAVLESQVKEGRSVQNIRQQQLQGLRGERGKLSVEEIRAELGPVCPVCQVPIERALAEGCGLSNLFQDPEEIARSGERKEIQIRACEQAIEDLRQRLRQQEAQRQRLQRREANLRQEIERREDRAKEQRHERRMEWLSAATLVDAAERLERGWTDLSTHQQRANILAEEQERLRQELEAHRRHHDATLARLQELFRYVTEGLLGRDAESRLELTGQGLRAEVRVGGTAMESLKVLAFDLAALLMSLEGRARLPALLIHDSPREADLGISVYHRLFRLMKTLETLGPEPPFQYIVTTTTEPPAEMVGGEEVVLRLRGLEEGERLLRRAI